MFDFLKKKKKEDGLEDVMDDNLEDNLEDESEDEPVEDAENIEDSLSKKDENSKITKLSADLEKVKAGVEGFTEIRKSFTERFSRVSEQIGELRSMILERDKTIQEIELKAIKSADLVEAVHPEKIMTEVHKQEAKAEALKASLEGNEAIMDRVMNELKETKRKVEFFRGVDEIVKLSEDVKAELIEIKKIESRININTDKVETLYAEIRSKFKDIDGFKSELREKAVQIEQNIKDIIFLKEKSTGLVDKEELEKTVDKVQRHIDTLKKIEKTSSLSKDISQLRNLLEDVK